MWLCSSSQYSRSTLSCPDDIGLANGNLWQKKCGREWQRALALIRNITCFCLPLCELPTSLWKKMSPGNCFVFIMGPKWPHGTELPWMTCRSSCLGIIMSYHLPLNFGMVCDAAMAHWYSWLRQVLHIQTDNVQHPRGQVIGTRRSGWQSGVKTPRIRIPVHCGSLAHEFSAADPEALCLILLVLPI